MLSYDVISICAFLTAVSSAAPTSLYCIPGEEKVVLNGSVQCRPCEDGFYSGGEKCRKCSQCDRHQSETIPCTSRHDRRCVCPERKFFHEGKHTCSTCKNCSKEEYQTRDCIYNRNRMCAPCPSGYRSATVNARRCALRMTEAPRMTEATTAAREVPSNVAVYVTGTLVAVFGTIILVFLACFCRRKRRHACQRRHEAHQLAKKEGEFLDSPLVAPSDRPPRPQSYRQQDHLPSAPHVVSVDATLGVHLGRVNASVIQELASKLNPQRAKNNWKSLAAQLGFSTEEIANYELDPRSATQSMLTDWNTKHGSTVNKLYNVLQPLRPDAAFLLEPYLAF